MTAHVAIDLETTGKGINAAIITIGACKFIPESGEIRQRFLRNIDLASVIRSGGEIDASTFKWWLEQSNEARMALLNDSNRELLEVLEEFDAFLHDCASGEEELFLWGNGIGSDNIWLRATYARIGRTMPVPFWADMDVRTAVFIGRMLGVDPKRERQFDGTLHNAADDATHQARYTSDILQYLLSLKSYKAVHDDSLEEFRCVNARRGDIIQVAGTFMVVTGMRCDKGRCTITMCKRSDGYMKNTAELTVRDTEILKRLK